ncbi:MAG: type I-F CRISPR-associated protein Csy2 [Proteobacteria bacterium]|nr:type I-F CRISPR-associated protein Csy2 [Pseudomonadota bacterium]
MSNAYIVFERISVQDANCIAGFTYGFPAITHFLGFGHALSRRLSATQKLTLQGCAVICHRHQIHTYQPKGYGDYVFAQSKNPPTTRAKAKETPPIIEEGKMDMTVSLIMVCPNLQVNKVQAKALKQSIMNLAYQHRLAGGAIQNITAIHIFDKDEQKLLRIFKRLLLPGFVLMDRSDLLASHYETLKQQQSDAELVDTWLDFPALKYQAKPKLKEGELDEPTEKTEAEWVRMDKPAKGWLVPITNGYKAISDVYAAGEVANARDTITPVCFVEASHSIGEWRSLHRIQQIADTLWHYHHEQDWYLCRQGEQTQSEFATNELENVADDDFEDDFLNSLN